MKKALVILAMVAFMWSSTALASGGKNRKCWQKRLGTVSSSTQQSAVPVCVQQRDRDRDRDGDCDGECDGPNHDADGNGPDGDGPNGYGPGDGDGYDGDGPQDGSGYGPGCD